MGARPVGSRTQAHVAERGVLGGRGRRSRHAAGPRPRGALPGGDLAHHDHHRPSQARCAALDRVRGVPRRRPARRRAGARGQGGVDERRDGRRLRAGDRRRTGGARGQRRHVRAHRRRRPRRPRRHGTAPANAHAG